MQGVIQPSPYNNLSIDRVLINWKLASGEKKKKKKKKASSFNVQIPNDSEESKLKFISSKHNQLITNTILPYWTGSNKFCYERLL